MCEKLCRLGLKVVFDNFFYFLIEIWLSYFYFFSLEKLSMRDHIVIRFQLSAGFVNACCGVCVSGGCKSRCETRKYGSIDRVQHCACNAPQLRRNTLYYNFHAVKRIIMWHIHLRYKDVTRGNTLFLHARTPRFVDMHSFLIPRQLLNH